MLSCFLKACTSSKKGSFCARATLDKRQQQIRINGMIASRVNGLYFIIYLILKEAMPPWKYYFVKLVIRYLHKSQKNYEIRFLVFCPLMDVGLFLLKATFLIILVSDFFMMIFFI